MQRWIQNVFRLGLKEIVSLSRDVVMVALIAFEFTGAVYSEADAMKVDINNARVAIVDADQSTLSGRIKDALQPPYFQAPGKIDRSDVDRFLDKGAYTFILEIPPRLEFDLLANRGPSIQINVDATAVAHAAVGTAYIHEIIMRETASFLKQRDATATVPINPVIRALFNQNLDAIRFTGSMGVINNLTILAIVLVGAAVMRERERGTIEHLLVMPVRASEIVAAKIWANGLVILLAAAFSLHVIVHFLLGVPVIGSVELFLAGAAVYLFALSSIPVFVIMFLLSGSFTPFESMPALLQDVMYISPSTHFVRFGQAALYRGAGIGVVWPDLAIMAGLGGVFIGVALSRFRAMLARQS